LQHRPQTITFILEIHERRNQLQDGGYLGAIQVKSEDIWTTERRKNGCVAVAGIST